MKRALIDTADRLLVAAQNRLERLRKAIAEAPIGERYVFVDGDRWPALNAHERSQLRATRGLVAAIKAYRTRTGAPLRIAKLIADKARDREAAE